MAKQPHPFAIEEDAEPDSARVKNSSVIDKSLRDSKRQEMEEEEEEKEIRRSSKRLSQKLSVKDESQKDMSVKYENSPPRKR